MPGQELPAYRCNDVSKKHRADMQREIHDAVTLFTVREKICADRCGRHYIHTSLLFFAEVAETPI
jgi:hypothetical protein